MSAAAALSIRGLAKAFGDQPVLSELELDVPAGSLTAVLGSSGCGKTTLLRLIAGFERADAGSITLGEQLVASDRVHLAPERRGLGFVAQEGALFPHLDVAANVTFGLPRARRRGGRVGELLELVGLAGLGARMAHELSGGQQQRVALARALAPTPRVVLLDEPFSALDPTLRASLRADVRAALRQTGTTALLVTHDQLEALSVADQVGVLRDGRIVQTADPRTLYSQPVDPDVAQFVGEAVLLPAQLSDGHAHCVLGRLPVRGGTPDGGAATAMIRPEQLTLGDDPDSVSGRVLGITYYGHDAAIRLSIPTGNGVDCEVTARTAGHRLPDVGQTVALAVHGEVIAYPRSSTPNLTD
jgi:iron(III) transport system ATP-binding protein